MKDKENKNFAFFYLFTYTYLSVESIMTVLYIFINISCHDTTDLYTCLGK